METVSEEHKRVYTPILPESDEWPVVKLSKNRKAFIASVIEESLRRVKEDKSPVELVDEIESTLYRERIRIKKNRWAVDPDDEIKFWKHVKETLVHITGTPREEEELVINNLLHEIVSRYSHEIAGTFKRSSYRFARRFITFGFARLLNASRVKGFRSVFSDRYTLRDKLNIVGEIDHLRELGKKGTIVMVPTHFSNLDSILIGWVISELGLPPFIYGAGLNLFNIGVIAYFMNSLGAYKVDRRKKNRIYLETLKTYSTLALQYGCHSLFFPGGTRSRAGRLESQLKFGLLSSVIESQRINFQKETGRDRKIFVVPVVINYHFVLEAPTLIKDFLEKEGQERYYVEKDEFSTSYRIISFLFKFFTKGSDISVSIGKPMDIFGNTVDYEGNSYDNQGRPIDTREYFMTNGEVTEDEQREHVYTRMLGESILDSFYKHNRVFSSHLVAFTAFEIIRNGNIEFDLYDLLRQPEEDLVIEFDEFCRTVNRVRNRIYELRDAEKLDVAPHLLGDIEQVVKHGVNNVGLYHAKRPLLLNKEGSIVTQDIKLLYYYHNRLTGYELEQYI